MLDASTSGRALPKSKSINVEANLLEEWLYERNRLSDLLLMRVLALGAVLLIAGVTLPLLYRAQGRARISEAKSKQALAIVAKQLGEATAKSESIKPQMELAQMREESGQKLQAFAGQILFLLNAVPADVVLQNLRAEVAGGEVTLKCKAEAIDAEAGRRFTEAAARGPGTVSALQAMTRASDALGPGGVTFDFVKRATVTP